MPDDLEKKQALLKIVREAASIDAELRKQFQIGEKFRFIRDRLHALVARVEENLAASTDTLELTDRILGENETLVYVYLFNAQGMSLQSWTKLLNPSVFYEYSVNRPIYLEKSYIEAIIRTKSNKAQQGYITVAVNKEDIISTEDAKDIIGNPVIKVKEGSLHPDKFISFTHNFVDYTLNADNQIVRKETV